MSGRYGKKRFFKLFIDRTRKKSINNEEAERQIIKKETHIYRSDDVKQEKSENENYNKFDFSDSECVRASSAKKSGNDLVSSVCSVITVVAVLASLSVTGYALYTAKKPPAESVPTVSDPYSNIPDEEKKIIFIREHDGKNGALTPSEIYEKCKSSVVTVICGDGSSVGSGFIYSADGYIATAAHVVNDKEQISVITWDGRKYAAQIVRADNTTDVALLKTEAQNLSAVSFGNSADLLVGEVVYAIGTPASADFAGSFCSGEITYLNRALSVYNNTGMLEKKMKVIQTNAVLNPGNSGCPLFDAYGRVVGMVSMKLGGDYNGIGFALPSVGVSAVLDAMYKNEIPAKDIVSGFVTMAPKLGALGETVYGDGKYGYRIDSFYECGSNAKAVLETGDMIIGIDGEAVSRYDDIIRVINQKNPGDTVRVTVLRNNQELTFNVILGE